MRKSVLRGVGAIAGAAAALAAPLAGSAASSTYTVGPISNLSSTSCSGQNAEVEQAADAQRGYVYVVWMGCSKIAFSRSTDGGVSFSPAITVPAPPVVTMAAQRGSKSLWLTHRSTHTLGAGDPSPSSAGSRCGPVVRMASYGWCASPCTAARNRKGS